jgi:AcrR family transcriptional regulator
MAGYHHGNLRDAILTASASAIARDGIGGLSLRAIATDLGVSHTAFRRHFGGREGVLNALAVQGNRWLADQLRAAGKGVFGDVGVAYVRFALTHPGHFAVMFRPDLLDNDDPELTAARADALAPLREGVQALGAADSTAAEVARWGMVHGIAMLALTGSLTDALAGPLGAPAAARTQAEIEELARAALTLLDPATPSLDEK